MKRCEGFVSFLFIDDSVKWSLGLECSSTLWNDTQNSFYFFFFRLTAVFLSLYLVFFPCYRDGDGHSGGHSWTGLDGVSQFWGELLIDNNHKECMLSKEIVSKVLCSILFFFLFSFLRAAATFYRAMCNMKQCTYTSARQTNRQEGRIGV